MTARPPPADQLSYGSAAPPRTALLAWVGLGLAVLGALLVATQVMIVARESAANVRFAWTVPARHLLLPALGILLAAFGWRRDARKWPAVAVGVGVLSLLTLLLLGSRTWGRPMPGGQSPWHWPTFDWRA